MPRKGIFTFGSIILSFAALLSAITAAIYGAKDYVASFFYDSEDILDPPASATTTTTSTLPPHEIVSGADLTRIKSIIRPAEVGMIYNIMSNNCQDYANKAVAALRAEGYRATVLEGSLCQHTVEYEDGSTACVSIGGSYHAWTRVYENGKFVDLETTGGIIPLTMDSMAAEGYPQVVRFCDDNGMILGSDCLPYPYFDMRYTPSHEFCARGVC